MPPYGWSLLRNGFLVVQGLGVMALILRDARRAGDRPFELTGWMIALSYLFYAPVILWSAAVPLLRDVDDTQDLRVRGRGDHRPADDEEEREIIR